MVIRANLYHYDMTRLLVRVNGKYKNVNLTSNWWDRTYIQSYLEPVTLQSLEQVAKQYGWDVDKCLLEKNKEKGTEERTMVVKYLSSLLITVSKNLRLFDYQVVWSCWTLIVAVNLSSWLWTNWRS